MNELLAVTISAVVMLGALAGMLLAPGTRLRRSVLATCMGSSLWWAAHTLVTSTQNHRSELRVRNADHDNLCWSAGHRLSYLARASEIARDTAEFYDDSWTSMQLEGHGTLRVIGPVLRYCVRDAASCDSTIQALLDGQRPEAPFSTAPTYRAHLKVLADAFENREGCKP